VLVALVLTYLGIFLTMGGFHLEVLRANLFGAAMVLVSALTFSIYFLIGERYTREIGTARFTLFAMTSSAIAVAAHYAAFGSPAAILAFDAVSWLLVAPLAIFCMFLPSLLIAEGIRRIGAERGAVVSTVSPPTTIVLAWLLLGERMTVAQLLGAALIVIGILALDLAKLRSAVTGRASAAAPGPEPAVLDARPGSR
jgi:drug/metabolite transporter (DMT)-like permease